MRLLASFAVLAVALAGCGGTRTVTTTVTNAAPATTAAATPAAARAGGTFERIPQIVKRVSPSIVTIFATLPGGQAEGSGVI